MNAHDQRPRRRAKWLVIVTTVLASVVSTSPAAAGGATVLRGKVDARVVGGTPTSISSVPWQVAIVDRSNPNTYDAQFCGGSIVGARWIVTAAHCVTDVPRSQMQVVAGVTRLSTAPASARRDVLEKVVHRYYDPFTNSRDIAMLRVSGPDFPVSWRIRINGWTSGPTVGTPYGIAGWGWDGSAYPDQLHSATVQDMAGPNGPCGAYGAAYRPARMLCAGVPGGGRDTCSGDSGGPLWFTPADGIPTLAGVTSFGNDCALASYPGVYTRVSDNVGFITYRAPNARVYKSTP